MNMKKVIGLFFLSLIVVVAFAACGDDAADINTCKYANVPASLISDPAKLKMLHSIQDLDDGRFFTSTIPPTISSTSCLKPILRQTTDSWASC